MTTQDLHPPCSNCGGRVRKPDGRCGTCGEFLDSSDTGEDSLLGALVANRFRVERLIGVGGVGRVYRADQEELGRRVALKVLHPTMAGSTEQKGRFHREAQAASRLNHPGSVIVYDYGEWRGQLYIAMEFLSGRTLASVLDEEYPLSDERVVTLLAQVAEVLAAAHDAGVLHRDLKPENIMVQYGPGGDEQIKVVDFGLASLQENKGMAKLTQEGVVSGTPAYMSPEQCRGKDMDARSDIYALGVILYETLTGDVPFTSEAPVEVLVQHLFNPPRPPSEVVQGEAVHPGLERVALHALSKTPNERPQTALELRRLLLDAISDTAAQAAEPRGATVPLTRAERADAIGLRRPPARTQVDRPNLPHAPVVLVLEATPDRPESLTTLVQANGLTPIPVGDLDEATVRVVAQRPSAVVLDLREDAEALYAELHRVMHEERLVGAPVVVIGPEDDLEGMTRALNLGVAHYVPDSTTRDKLPKILRRLQKKALRERARRKDTPGA